MGAVEQGHSSPLAGFEDELPSFGVDVQLLSISPPELVPTIDSVAKPPPKLRAGCDLLDPRIRLEVLLRHSTWPEALDQDSPTISARGRVVRALDSNHSCALPTAQQVLFSRQLP